MDVVQIGRVTNHQLSFPFGPRFTIKQVEINTGLGPNAFLGSDT